MGRCDGGGWGVSVAGSCEGGCSGGCRCHVSTNRLMNTSIYNSSLTQLLGPSRLQHLLRSSCTFSLILQSTKVLHQL